MSARGAVLYLSLFLSFFLPHSLSLLPCVPRRFCRLLFCLLRFRRLPVTRRERSSSSLSSCPAYYVGNEVFLPGAETNRARSSKLSRSIVFRLCLTLSLLPPSCSLPLSCCFSLSVPLSPSLSFLRRTRARARSRPTLRSRTLSSPPPAHTTPHGGATKVPR